MRLVLLTATYSWCGDSKRRRKVPTLGNPNSSGQTASTSRVASDDA
nr:hypothetical protein [Flavobacterium sp. 1]